MEEFLAQIPNWATYALYLGAFTVVFRLLAELFNKIAEATENKTDDLWAQRICNASWAVAKFFAIFGIRAGLAVPRHLKDDNEQ